jgi:hypothetical protein
MPKALEGLKLPQGGMLTIGLHLVVRDIPF